MSRTSTLTINIPYVIPAPHTILLGAIFFALPAYFIGVAIYRLRFHPLADVPGPKLNAISGWPEWWISIWGNKQVELQLLHQKYGDRVRVAPNSVSFRTAGAVHDIYADRKANVIKTGWTEASLELLPFPNVHTMPDRELHAKRRRLVNPGFSEVALRGMEDKMLSHIDSWINMLGEAEQGKPSQKNSWSSPKDMGAWTTFLTVDVLGDLCFGKSFEAKESRSLFIPHAMVSSTKMTQWLAYNPLKFFLFPFARMDWLMNIIIPDISRQRLGFRKRVRQAVTERLALEEQARREGKEGRKDFFKQLSDAQDPATGQKFTLDQLLQESILYTAAGTDTTSTCLSALLFYLTRYPRTLTKLQQEVRGAFSNYNEIKSGHEISALPYLRACIDECLRITPPIPGHLTRKVLAGGINIDGYWYPEGTTVAVAPYNVHHNETYFPDPFTFIPERWIPGSQVGFPVNEQTIEAARAAYMPFSVGPRICLGRNMAVMELLSATAKLVYTYDIRPLEGSKLGGGNDELGPGRGHVLEYQTQDFFVSDKAGPMIEYKRRV